MGVIFGTIDERWTCVMGKDDSGEMEEGDIGRSTRNAGGSRKDIGRSKGDAGKLEEDLREIKGIKLQRDPGKMQGESRKCTRRCRRIF
jgi:hypothetical protein